MKPTIFHFRENLRPLGGYNIREEDERISFYPQPRIGRIIEDTTLDKIQFVLCKEKAQKRYKRDTEFQKKYEKDFEGEKWIEDRKNPKKQCLHCGVDFGPDCEAPWARGGNYLRTCCVCLAKYRNYCNNCKGTDIRGCKRSFCPECWDHVHICCDDCACKSRASAMACVMCKDCVFICEVCLDSKCKHHSGYYKTCKDCGKYACSECRGESLWKDNKEDEEEEDRECCQTERRKLTPEEEEDYLLWKEKVTLFNNQASKTNRKNIKKMKKEIDKSDTGMTERDKLNLDSLKKSFSWKKKCFVCGKSEGGMKKCARCQGIMYCGRKCQKKDWKRHKKQCQKRD